MCTAKSIRIGSLFSVASTDCLKDVKVRTEEVVSSRHLVISNGVVDRQTDRQTSFYIIVNHGGRSGDEGVGSWSQCGFFGIVGEGFVSR
jgi:hypothetical protein